MTNDAVKHSPLGASGYHRWRRGACPGSVRLSRGLVGAASVYAAEGSCAHHIAAQCLMHGTLPAAFLGQVLEFDGHKIKVEQDMVDHVAGYVKRCRDDAEEGDSVFTEVAVALPALHPDLYGTADRVVYKQKAQRLVVRDLKYGEGEEVEVEDNPQLLYYALGAFGLIAQRGYAVSEVELIIDQPRRANEEGLLERRHKFSVAELVDFQVDLREDALATEAPDAPLRAGDYCRWCKAAAICPELKAKANAVAKVSFTPLVPYDPAELATALRWADVAEGRIKAVREFAYLEATKGRTPPGFKLVAKRATRKWNDEERARTTLLVEVGVDVLEPPKLRSPAQMEQLLGKKKFKNFEAELVSKISSGDTLVEASDPRPAIKQDPQSHFTPISGPKEVAK